MISSLKNLGYLKQNTFIGFGARVIDSRIGRNVRIGKFSYVKNSTLQDYVRIGMFSSINKSKFGRYTYVGRNSVVVRANIGAFTSISWNVTIGAAEHKFDIVTTHNMMYDKFQGFIGNRGFYDPHKGDVLIGNDVWIGANVVIKRRINIGDGAVIGAGAVVTKDIPNYAIAVGVPARVVRYRFSKETIKELKKLKWWELPDSVIRDNLEVLSANPENPDVIEKLWHIKESVQQVDTQ